MGFYSMFGVLALLLFGGVVGFLFGYFTGIKTAVEMITTKKCYGNTIFNDKGK